MRAIITRIACLVAALAALGACDFKPIERCDGTGRLNLSVNGYVFHVKDREISGISFWNQLRPPAIVKPWGYKEPNNCRSDRYGKGPVEVRSFSAYIGGPNGLLLNFQSRPFKGYDRPTPFEPVETTQIKAIKVGEPEGDGSISRVLPLEFHLHDGTVRQWSTQCLAPLRADTVPVGRCRVLLPLRGGPWLMIQTAGAWPDEPERIRRLERNIVVGLTFAEQLQEQSERANRSEWE